MAFVALDECPEEAHSFVRKVCEESTTTFPVVMALPLLRKGYLWMARFTPGSLQPLSRQPLPDDWAQVDVASTEATWAKKTACEQWNTVCWALDVHDETYWRGQGRNKHMFDIATYSFRSDLRQCWCCGQGDL